MPEAPERYNSMQSKRRRRRRKFFSQFNFDPNFDDSGIHDSYTELIQYDIVLIPYDTGIVSLNLTNDHESFMHVHRPMHNILHK